MLAYTFYFDAYLSFDGFGFFKVIIVVSLSFRPSGLSIGEERLRLAFGEASMCRDCMMFISLFW